jgi:hypothetical protein
MVSAQKFSKKIGDKSFKFGINTQEILISACAPSILNLVGFNDTASAFSFAVFLILFALKNTLLRRGQIKKSISRPNYIHIEKMEIK